MLAITYLFVLFDLVHHRLDIFRFCKSRYDSILVNGQLRWQDRLNSLNLPFFLSSDEFFTNYTWPPNYPSLTAQYFLSLDPTLFQSSSPKSSLSKTENQLNAHTKSKSLQDIYIGVDTWGRGSHGGGGYHIYKAFEHIDPKFLGLSVALFGQAWTWENEQDEPGWNWEKWWRSERMLWIGPTKGEESVVVRPADPNRSSSDIKREFTPVSSYFHPRTPPNPRDLALFTIFSPGVGYKWFVEGKEVMARGKGWTDVDKQTSLGDLLWPVPRVEVEGVDESDNEVPESRVVFSFENAWNGGSSVVLTLTSTTSAGLAESEVSFQCFWIPVQSIAVSPGLSYDATLVYKHSYGDAIDVTVGLSAKVIINDLVHDVNIDVISDEEVSNGWNRVSIRFSCSSSSESSADIPASIGLVMAIAAEDLSLPSYEIKVHLGQLTVVPSLPKNNDLTEPRIIWTNTNLITVNGKEFIELTWDLAPSFTENVNLNGLTSSEDPNPVWRIDHSLDAVWFPKVVYYNIYGISRSSGPRSQPDSAAEVSSSNPGSLHPSNATFIGTSGLDGVGNRVVLEKNHLNDVVGNDGRIYVQGVTELGNVLPWEKCSYVDLVARI